MGQLEMHLAQSVAAERHAATVRDAEVRRVSRERSTGSSRARENAWVRSAHWLSAHARMPVMR